MNQIRPRQKRSLGFDALEGRLTLSTGMASPHIHALAVTQTKIPASFKGHASIINGSTAVISSLTGRIGSDRFTGSGSGTVAGRIFQSGDVFLKNSHGTIHLGLGPVIVTHVGKSVSQKVPFVVLESSGKYAQFTGTTGMLTSWNTPVRPKAISTFSGFIRVT